MHKLDKYWLKPKRFWGWFAAYYPVTREGWTVTVLVLLSLALVLSRADATSHSASDTFFAAAPGVIIILLAFDLVFFRTGEYLSWWKKLNEKS